MRYLFKVGAAVAIGMLLIAVGCEDTDPTAPADGEIRITASPGTVVIDVQARHATVFHVHKARVNVGLEADLFTLTNLRKRGR